MERSFEKPREVFVKNEPITKTSLIFATCVIVWDI
jgi:hypothetical protein